MLWSGRMVTGSTIIPDSLRLTRSTSSAWASTDRFLWTMPMPPSWARAMARRDSVTVSMAAERMGMFISIPRQTWVRSSTWFGWTSDRPGTSEMSSNVRARRGSKSVIGSFKMARRVSGSLAPMKSIPMKRAAVGRPRRFLLRRRSSPDRHRRAVALLVLLARAAGAGVVASHFGLAADRGLWALPLDLGRRGELDPGRRPLLAGALLEHLLLGDRLVAEELLDDVVLHPLAHHLEQVEALLLVLLERIALAVAAQADAFLQVVEGEEVVLPGHVHRVEHDGALEAADDLLGVAALLLDVALLDRLPEGIAQLVDAEMVEAQIAGVDVEVGEHLGAQAGEVPFLRVGLLGAVEVQQPVDDVLDDAHHVVAPFAPFEDVAAKLVDRLALLVHHVVVFEEVLADLEIPSLDLGLGALDRLADHAVLDRLPLFHAEAAHDPLDAVGAEDPHEVVFEREIETGGAGVPLATGAAAELVVDAPRLVPLGAQDVQAAEVEHLLALAGAGLLIARQRLLVRLGLGLRIGLGAGQPLGVAAEHDVGAAAGHVGGDGDRPLAAGLGHDRSLALVVLGVEHHVRHPRRAVEQLGEHLALLDRHRAHQHRLPPLLRLADLLDHRVPLLLGGAVDEVRAVVADHVAVGGDDVDVKLVDLVELGRLGVGGAGPGGEAFFHPGGVFGGGRGGGVVVALALLPPPFPPPPAHA